MQKYEKKLLIAGIYIKIVTESPFQFPDRCAPFETFEEKTDVTIDIKVKRKENLSDFKLLYSSEKYTILKSKEEVLKKHYCDKDKKIEDWHIRKKINDWTMFEISVLNTDVIHLDMFNPLYFIDFPQFMIQYNAMILHSSYIKFHEKAILFSAPSGVGKSTQADIWAKYYNAQIINGDRTIIRKEKIYKAYGSPYAGSSRIFKNECCNLAAIIVIKQAKYNRIRRMEKKEAYLHILSEMGMYSYDKNIVEKQTTWVLELISEIPIYMLECLPNKMAAEVVFEELKGII